MSDDLKNRGVADRARINIHEEHELVYWTKTYGCTRQELQAAVEAVGPLAVDVEANLKKKSN